MGARLSALCFFMFGGLLTFLSLPIWMGGPLFLAAFVALSLVLRSIDAREERERLKEADQES